MKALGHRVLQATVGIGFAVALTWPLLVGQRPVLVSAAIYSIWGACIGVLFLMARAPRSEPGADEAADEESDA